MTLTNKDHTQTLRYAFDDDINAFRIAGNLVPEHYDEIDITYTATDEIDTITYSLAGAIIATITCSYNLDDLLIGVVRT